MFLLVLAALVCFLGWCFRKYEKMVDCVRARDDIKWDEVGSVCYILAVMLVIVMCAVSMASYTGQILDFEEITRLRSVEEIYHKKADALTKEFASYLAEAYPQHEKDVFASMSPDSVGLYMVKYPDLKASDTILALVQQIESLRSDQYDQEIEEQAVLKRIRYRPRNPWIINWFIPEMDEE